MFTYGLKRRYFPKTLKKVLGDKFGEYQKKSARSRFGIVTIGRALSLKEARRFRVRLLDAPRMTYDFYGVTADGSQEFLYHDPEPFKGRYTPARRRAKELGRKKDFVDYVARPRTDRR